MDADRLDERLHAVERALTGDDTTIPDLEDSAAVTRRLDGLDDRLDTLDARLDNLDAATQALRGYVGNVRSVNREVERRADLALSRVERVESRVEETETQLDDCPPYHQPPRADRRTSTGESNQQAVQENAGRTSHPVRHGPSTRPSEPSQSGPTPRTEWWDEDAPTQAPNRHEPTPNSRTFLDRLTEWL